MPPAVSSDDMQSGGKWASLWRTGRSAVWLSRSLLPLGSQFITKCNRRVSLPLNHILNHAHTNFTDVMHVFVSPVWTPHWWLLSVLPHWPGSAIIKPFTSTAVLPPPLTWSRRSVPPSRSCLKPELLHLYSWAFPCNHVWFLFLKKKGCADKHKPVHTVSSYWLFCIHILFLVSTTVHICLLYTGKYF